MTTTTATTGPRPTATTLRQPYGAEQVLDNRPSYVAFGLAWLLGHGAFALSSGDDPVVDLPAPVPIVLLAGGLLAGIAVASVTGARARRTATRAQARVADLLTGSWVVGFTALFLLITALTGVTGDDHVQTVLWPTGSGLVVGLIYLAGGAAYRDRLQYALGSWLAVTSTLALFLDTPGLYWPLALAGGGGYLVAAALEPRRRAAANRG